MKLHLPVRLFRAVLGLMLAAPSLLHAAYTSPSYISPLYSYTDRVYSSSEIDDVWGYSSNYNVLLETNVSVGSSYAPVMGSSDGSRYFASASASYLCDLYLSYSSSRWFNVNDYKNLTFAALDELTFYDNGSTSNNGGVIYADYDNDITLSQNYRVSFNSNMGNRGGAIYSSSSYNTLTVQNNAYVEFVGNYAYNYQGGAIYNSGGSVDVSGNGSVQFSSNSASTDGGGIYSYGGSVEVSENDSVLFSGNSAGDWGGAICGTNSSSVNILNNGEVEFIGNKASGSGGAIYGSSGSAINIAGNSSVLFEKNAVGSYYGSYNLRSIYTGGRLSLSAPDSGEIRFHDTIYVGEDLNLNSSYTDADGYTRSAGGDIIFDGQYAESHLTELYGYTPSSSEVTTSRTSTVSGSTYLYGGTLQLKGGACLNGYGFSATGGKVYIGNATLNQNSYSASFASGTTLSVGAGSKMTASTLYLNSGSTLEFDLSSGYSDAYFTLSGDLSIGGSLTLNFLNTSYLDESNYKLMYVSGSRSGWYTYDITLTGIAASVDDLSWVDGYLILNYKGGNLEYTSQLTGSVDLRRYTSVTFRDSSNYSQGAAIYSSSSYNDITLSDNDSLVFRNNSVSASGYYSTSSYGGAIYKSGGSVNIHDNGTVSFSGNSATSSSEYYSASSYGGAIYSTDSLDISSNGSVSFSGNSVSAESDYYSYYESNTAGAYGGAICSTGSLDISSNGIVSFSGNTVSADADYYSDYYSNTAGAYGGAIYGTSSIEMDSNTSVSFTNNSAQEDGEDEAAARGGAIWGNYGISLVNNGTVTFSGNKVSALNAPDGQTAQGGAIYSSGALSIRNNTSVLFEKNVEKTDSGYQLRGVYVASDAGTVSLSAASGNSIEFRDSVYIGSGNTVELNNTYTDANGVSHSQVGDIIFTGAYVDSDLRTAKGYVNGTSEEVLNSQTSHVHAMTNLYGGRLCVEAGAIYSGYGITAESGSASTVRVKNATLDLEGYALTLNAGTALELLGENILNGDVMMESASRLSFVDTMRDEATFVHGNVSFSDSLTLSLSGVENCENNILMYVLGDISGWDDAELTMATSSYGASSVTWVRNCLVLNYNAATFAPYVKGDIAYLGKENERITEPLSLYFYNNVLFDYMPVKADYTGNPYGGAVSSEGNIFIRLNGTVTFSNNTVTHASATRGGAIYGTNIALCDNGEVIFRANRTISTGKGAYNANAASGGAIYGVGRVRGNSSVLFSGNDVIAENNAYGGAIYVGSIIDSNGYEVAGSMELAGNEKLEFSRNTVASASSSYGGAICVENDRNLTISDNGSVLFSMNSSATSSAVDNTETLGGAIYVSNGRLEISGNDYVVFAKNAEKISGNASSRTDSNDQTVSTQYRLRGLYVDGATSDVFLSAEEGQSITFRDSIHIDDIDEFSLNAGGAGGDIIFTGATTVADLKEMRNGHDGTAAEIEDSRTSEVYTMTNLYGGRLIVEDSAVYRCSGITAWGDYSNATTVLLRNATLARTTNQMSSQFTFHRGTTLAMVGANKIAAEALTMMDASTWEFNLSAENRNTPMLSYSGLLYVKGTLYINIKATETLGQGEYKLMQVSQSIGNWWNERDVIVNGSALTLNDLQWVDNTLYFMYTGQNIPLVPGDTVSPDSPVNPGALTAFTPNGNILSSNLVNQNNDVRLSGSGSLTLEGKVNAGAFTVNIGKNLTLKSNKKNPGSLFGAGDLSKSGAGTLTLNDGNTGWTGNVYLNAGTIKVKGTSSLGKGDVYLNGGILNLGSKAVSNDIVQSGNAAIKSGKKFAGTYTLEKGELQKGSVLNINGGKTATLQGGTVNGTISGNGTVNVTGTVKLGATGKITTSALTLGANATLTTGAKGLSSKNTDISVGENATLNLVGKVSADSLSCTSGTLKATAPLALKGNLSVSDSAVVCSGKVSAANLSMTGTEFKLVASAPQSIALKGNATLTDSTLTANGKMSANNLTLNNSALSLTASKPQNLTVKQNLTVNTGSSLTLNGKLSAGSLTLKSGSTLTLTGSKPQTVKVKGTLTINSGSCIDLNYSFDKGKTYKLLTFGSYSGSQDFYSLFGVSASDCLLVNTGKALTLTVTGNWNPQFATTASLAMEDELGEAVYAGEETKEEGSKVENNTPVLTMPDNRPLADALVQANWGQLEASRAFVNAMANRSMAVQLGNGERAVWASAIGASTRYSGANGHHGSDANVSGGAFGLETQVGSASLFGLALGNSWTRVSAHGFGTIEQDTTHLGVYGQSNWTSGISADWSAAYGRSESECMGSDWNQKHLQLDGRMSYNHELSAGTLLRPFAGVQYYTSDSATIGSADAGSLQNLRTEIGVGASHREGKLGVYGELAVHYDAARNNPDVEMNGKRYTGMNPGRAGLNFSVGASYDLSDDWSVNASYTGEFVENANAHSANVGATYKF